MILLMIVLRNIRSVSFLLFQELSPRGASFVPALVSSPSLLLWLECIFSSLRSPLSSIDVYKHLYKPVAAIHLLKSIGEEDDRNSAIFKGVEGFGNTQ